MATASNSWILRTIFLLFIVGLLCLFGYGKVICADDDVNPFQKQHLYTTPQEIVEDHLRTHQEPIGGGRRFGVFVNTTLYEQISDSIWTYIDDLESDGWQVILYTIEGGTTQEFKDLIRHEYQQGMVGCILIGELPAALFEDEVSGNVWPVELYYRDLDAEWIDSDGNGLFDQQLPGEGDLGPEIWTGRLYAESLSVDVTEKVGLIENYFRKNHAYREGKLTLPKRALDYAEDDFAGRQTPLTWLYNDVTLVDDNQQTSAGDYLHRLTEGYELVRLWAHGWGTGHGHPNKPCKAVAYAHCYAYSPVRQDVQLRLGSNDGIKVWLNGINVCTYDVYRGHRYDDDIVDVVLNEGWNRLLIKVSDKYGPWEFSARFSDLSGYDVNNLSYWLDNFKPQQPPLPQSGYIRDWLCNGWYKNQDDQTRLSQDYLGAEASVEPSEGEIGGVNEWKAHQSSEDYVDFDTLFKVERTRAGYKDIINVDPCCFFYDIYSCGSMDWLHTNYIDGWYIFTDSYGLASWGLIGSFYGPGTEFYRALGEGKCLGEAQLLYLNEVIADEFNIGNALFGMFGDPTLGPGPRPKKIIKIIYVNDDTPEDGVAAGNDENDGLTPQKPMRHIQAVLDRYPALKWGDIIDVSPGLYEENITLNAVNIGLQLKGAGQGLTIIDGGQNGICIYLHGFSAGTISGLTVTNGFGEDGGGIYAVNSSPTISACIISENYANVHGGGISMANGSSKIIDCTFTGNHCDGRGGAVDIRGVACPELISCLFTSNSSSGEGGAVLNTGSSKANISKCMFMENSGGGGGAICNHQNCTPVISSCVLGHNHSTTRGGAIKNMGDCSPTIKNCLIYQNSANRGGGIDNEARCTPIVANCTFSSNSVLKLNGGNGMYIDGTDGTMVENCIFWNYTNNSAPELYVRSNLTISYTDIKSGQAGILLGPDAVLTWGKGNIDANPLFADAENGDYHLKSQAGRWVPNSRDVWVMDSFTSPCIDSGNPYTAVGDEPMPNGGRINMGAYGGTSEASKSP